MSKVLQSFKLIKNINFNRIYRAIPNKTLAHVLPLSSQASSRNYTVQKLQPSIQEPLDNNVIANSFTKLKYDIEKQNKVVKSVYDALATNLIKRVGKVSNVQALALIRAVDFLYDESTSSRVEIANNLWMDLKTIGTPLDVSHYNSLLYIYVENQHDFLPANFLAQMEKDNVEPNRVTYQFLISKFCQDGNLDKARQILEYMKEKSIGVNEAIFNSLIAGNLKAKNIEEAKSVFQALKETQLKPTFNTYTALIKGFAENGDIEAIRQTYEELERENIKLPVLNSFEILASLALNNQEQYLSEIIENCPPQKFYSPRCFLHIYNLINANKSDVAYQLLQLLPNNYAARDLHYGLFFIKHLVKTNQSIDTVKLYCDKVEQANPNVGSYQKALESAYIYGHLELARGLLKAFQSKGIELRQQYFWPLLAHYSKVNDITGFINVLKFMEQLNCVMNVQTLCEMVIPICPNLVEFENRIAELKIHKSVLVYSKFQCALESGNLPLALEHASDKNFLIFAQKHMISVLAECYKRNNRNTNKVSEVVQILSKIGLKDSQGRAAAINGSFLLQLFGVRVSDFAEIIPAFEAAGLKVIPEVVEQFRRYYKNEPELAKNLEVLISNEEPFETIKEEHINASEIGKDKPYEKLLTQCRLRNFEKSHEILAKLEANNEPITATMYASLMDMCTATGHLEEALGYKLKIQELNPGFTIRTYKILNLAQKMTEAKRIDDALQLLADHKPHKDVENKFADNGLAILNNVCLTGDINKTTQTYNLLTKGGYIPVSNRAYGSLLKVHILNDDYVTALEKFEECCKTHNFTPLKNELITKFIELEDSEKLQRVVDVSTKIHGEISSLYDLALCFLQAGREAEAQKIFDTPGLRALNERLHFICNNLVKTGKTQVLETFVKMCQNLFEVNKEMLCLHLMQSYGHEGDYNKALAVWEDMQEQNILPTNKTLEYLHSLLVAHGQPVPFQVNQEALKYEPTNEPTKNLSYFIDNNKYEEAIELLKNSRENFQPKFSILKKALKTIADSGNVDLLIDLRNSLNVGKNRAFSVDYYIQSAFHQKGEFHKFFDLITSGSDYYLNFELLKDHLDKNPDRLEKVKQAISNLEGDSLLHANCMLWNFFFSNKDFAAAQETFNSNPKLNSWFTFQPLNKIIKNSNDYELAGKLNEFINSTDLDMKAKSFTNSLYASILAKNDKFDESVNVLQNFASTHGIENVSPTFLNIINDTFVLAKKSFPFEVPPQEGSMD